MVRAEKIRTTEAVSDTALDIADLIYRAQAGDKEAQSALWREIESYITGTVHRHLYGRSDDVHDVVQDVAVKVLQSIAQYRGESKFTTWLYPIILGCCSNYWKRTSKRLKHELRNEDGEGRQLEPEYSHGLIEKMIIRDFYDHLKPQDQRIIKLHYFEGLPREDVAELVGTTTRHVDYACEKFTHELRNVTKTRSQRKRSPAGGGPQARP